MRESDQVVFNLALDQGQLTQLLDNISDESRTLPWWSYFRRRELMGLFDLVQLCRRAWSAGYSAGKESMTRP